MFTTTDVDVDVWDGSVATKFGGGSGTETDPIIINEASQLALLNDNVNSGVTYSNVFFKLMTNIDLNNHTWESTGSFSGTLFGNSMKISRISSALFNTNNGNISDIIIDGNLSDAGICINNSGVIQNIVTNGVVSSSNNDVAGICLNNHGTIISCINQASIYSHGYGSTAGGIVAVNMSVIDKCKNKGTVYGEECAGGIVGKTSKSASKGTIDCGNIYNCINTGDISSKNNAGGLIGLVELKYTGGAMDSYSMSLTTSISNSINIGEISGITAGGICGFVNMFCCAHNNHYGNVYYFNTSLSVTNCINHSNIVTFGSYIKEAPEGNWNWNPSQSGLFTFGTTYWLYDVLNNVGCEYCIFNDMSFDAEHWYSRNGTSCNINGTNEDIVSKLNEWVYNNSSDDYLLWKYEMVDGYACPVFDE